MVEEALTRIRGGWRTWQNGWVEEKSSGSRGLRRRLYRDVFNNDDEEASRTRGDRARRTTTKVQ
jgi:hypothetical protein